MPDTNKNRSAVADAAAEVVKLWEADIWTGQALVEKEESLRKAVQEWRR